MVNLPYTVSLPYTVNLPYMVSLPYVVHLPCTVIRTCILIGLFQALRKKQLIASGKLGKFGKILETTPADVKKEFEL